MMVKIFRQAVMAVIVNEKNQILFGYSPRDKSYKFPQGGIENNEDLITGIQRELMEELAYKLHETQILSVFTETVHYHFPPDVHPLYKGQELSIVKIKHDPKTNYMPQDDEFDHVFWISPKEISNYNTEYRAEAYFKAIQICGLL